MRTARLILPLFLVCACVAAAAQKTPAPQNAGIHLDHSAVSLPGPWKFSPGDSPRMNSSFLWASPGFDDSHWFDMDLHSHSGEIDPGYGDAEYLKGWSARGFPNLAGYAWYRLRVHIDNPGEPLWIKMPDHTDDSYQVFANGKYVGEFGDFSGEWVKCYRSRALAFPLPAPDAHGDLVLAIRFYEEPFVLVGGTSGDSGGMHQAPVIGLAAQARAIAAREHTGRLLSVLVSVFVSGFLLIAAGGAFWIWLIDRPRRTYLWLAWGLVLLALPALATVVGFFTYVLTQGMMNEVVAALGAAGLICWLLFWRDWFDLPRTRRMTFLLIAVALVDVLGESGIFISQHLSIPWILVGMGMRAAGKLGLGILLFVVLGQGARKDRTGALLALPPILLLIVSQFSPELIAWFRVRTSIFPFGVQITLSDAALTLLVLVTGALALRRFIGSQVSQRLERQMIDQELEQARELQQHVLVPERNLSALYAVETAYHPARTVGGDFFQAVSRDDGSLLVVVGDVSGKGIAAAMLVAVLVGAVRTAADQTFDPAAILETLNNRLLGRAGNHFATCVAAHFHPSGAMEVASAGHPLPYRNGVALEFAGSLPLGVLPENVYEVSTIPLAEGDAITFLTDGVLEARDENGELLGFDGTAKLSSLSPAEIAEAAMRYGQDDDITVVGVGVRAVSREGETALRVAASPA